MKNGAHLDQKLIINDRLILSYRGITKKNILLELCVRIIGPLRQILSTKIKIETRSGLKRIKGRWQLHDVIRLATHFFRRPKSSALSPRITPPKKWVKRQRW